MRHTLSFCCACTEAARLKIFSARCSALTECWRRENFEIETRVRRKRCKASVKTWELTLGLSRPNICPGRIVTATTSSDLGVSEEACAKRSTIGAFRTTMHIGPLTRKRMKDKALSVIVGVADDNLARGDQILHEQEYKYRT